MTTVKQPMWFIEKKRTNLDNNLEIPESPDLVKIMINRLLFLIIFLISFLHSYFRKMENIVPKGRWSLRMHLIMS